MVHPAMYVSLVRKGDSVTGAQNIDVPSQAAGQQAARHDHVTAVTGVLGGRHRSSCMHGTTSMRLTLITVTDEQLRPLRSDQQQQVATACALSYLASGLGLSLHQAHPALLMLHAPYFTLAGWCVLQRPNSLRNMRRAGHQWARGLWGTLGFPLR
jgi:hypothetical protein